jgi:hypothetical protein
MPEVKEFLKNKLLIFESSKKNSLNIILPLSAIKYGIISVRILDKLKNKKPQTTRVTIMLLGKFRLPNSIQSFFTFFKIKKKFYLKFKNVIMKIYKNRQTRSSYSIKSLLFSFYKKNFKKKYELDPTDFIYLCKHKNI